MTEKDWSELSAGLVRDAMVLAVDKETGSPVARAVGEQRDGWIELGWVALAPMQRERGPGHAVCHTLVTHLLAAGQTRLLGSSQDHRSTAHREAWVCLKLYGQTLFQVMSLVRSPADPPAATLRAR